MRIAIEFKASPSTSSVEEVSEVAPGVGRSLSVLGSAQGGGFGDTSCLVF